MIGNPKSLFPLIALLAGCATGPHVERKQSFVFPITQTMDVEVRLAQNQMNVSHVKSIAGGAAGLQAAASPSVAAGGFAAGAAAGLIGVLIDAGINAHRSKVAEEEAAPLREHTAGIDFSALIYASLDRLDRNEFAPTINLEHLNTPESSDRDKHQLAAGNNILVLSPSYAVSYDETTFTYALVASLENRSRDSKGRIKTEYRYKQVFQYVLPVADTPDGASWEKLTADQWQTILTTAATETVAMLNYDIQAHPSDSLPRRVYGRQIVLLDRNQNSRAWVRSMFGMLSVESSQLKLPKHS